MLSLLLHTQGSKLYCRCQCFLSCFTHKDHSSIAGVNASLLLYTQGSQLYRRCQCFSLALHTRITAVSQVSMIPLLFHTQGSQLYRRCQCFLCCFTHKDHSSIAGVNDSSIVSHTRITALRQVSMLSLLLHAQGSQLYHLHAGATAFFIASNTRITTLSIILHAGITAFFSVQHTRIAAVLIFEHGSLHLF